jgi:hypothetical protein
LHCCAGIGVAPGRHPPAAEPWCRCLWALLLACPRALLKERGHVKERGHAPVMVALRVLDRDPGANHGGAAAVGGAVMLGWAVSRLNRRFRVPRRCLPMRRAEDVIRHLRGVTTHWREGCSAHALATT